MQWACTATQTCEFCTAKNKAVAERVPKPEGFNLTDGLYLGGAALVVAVLAVLLLRRARRYGTRSPR